jgi:tetratricopeptide (TPR) repeat protein
LAAARRSGDRRKLVAALTDLGFLHARACDGKQALILLEEALVLARQSADPAQESDVVINLGLAALAAGQPARALELLGQGLALSRATGDRFAVKAALERLGEAYARLRDPARALAHYKQARAVAEAVGDRRHTAELLWYEGVQFAELGRREQAVVSAEAAIALLRELGSPQAGWLAEDLLKYHAAEEGGKLGETVHPLAQPASHYDGQVAAGWMNTSSAQKAPGQVVKGPGLLRLAIASAKSLARFLASGLKTVPPSLHQQRVETCRACEHHTGLRCKVCGCFTNAKAWLPHEKCPLGRWQ